MIPSLVLLEWKARMEEEARWECAQQALRELAEREQRARAALERVAALEWGTLGQQRAAARRDLWRLARWRAVARQALPPARLCRCGDFNCDLCHPASSESDYE